MHCGVLATLEVYINRLFIFALNRLFSEGRYSVAILRLHEKIFFAMTGIDVLMLMLVLMLCAALALFWLCGCFEIIIVVFDCRLIVRLRGISFIGGLIWRPLEAVCHY